jgi:hypothetical protein
MAKNTPAQHFRDLFNRYIAGSTENERAEGEKAMDRWLRRHGKARIDAPKVLLQAAKDDEAAAPPPPPPPDPRAARPHPYEDPRFTPAGLVHDVTRRYLTMTPHVHVIYTLFVVATHIYRQFDVAARLALTSERPDSGKSEALKVAKPLMLRPNKAAFSTAAAIIDFIDEGPSTIGLDELDLLDAEARQRIMLLWNFGHDRALAKREMMVKGKRKLVDFYAPMMAAGLGSFLKDAQLTRTFVLEMHRYTAETKPEQKLKTGDTADLDAVYSYLRHWALNVKLNLDPAMPPGVIARDADNARSLLAVADACGAEWGQRAREAILFLLEKARMGQPQLRIIRHGLAIFDALGIRQIRSTQLNKELKRLDFPDADWTRYRGASGLDQAHPLTMNDQVKLLGMVGIVVKKCNPPKEKQFRGVTLEQFEEADRVHRASGAAVPRLRLVPTPSSE